MVMGCLLDMELVRESQTFERPDGTAEQFRSSPVLLYLVTLKCLNVSNLLQSGRMSGHRRRLCCSGPSAEVQHISPEGPGPELQLSRIHWA